MGWEILLCCLQSCCNTGPNESLLSSGLALQTFRSVDWASNAENNSNREHRMVMVSVKQSGQWPYKCSHLQRGHLNNWMTSKAGRGRIGEKREIQWEKELNLKDKRLWGAKKEAPKLWALVTRREITEVRPVCRTKRVRTWVKNCDTGWCQELRETPTWAKTEASCIKSWGILSTRASTCLWPPLASVKHQWKGKLVETCPQRAVPHLRTVSSQAAPSHLTTQAWAGCPFNSKGPSQTADW